MKIKTDFTTKAMKTQFVFIVIFQSAQLSQIGLGLSLSLFNSYVCINVELKKGL